MQSSTIQVTGMTCNHCVRTITKALSSVGVSNSKVDLSSGSVHVEYEANVSLGTIEEAIENKGYKVVKDGETVSKSGLRITWLGFLGFYYYVHMIVLHIFMTPPENMWLTGFIFATSVVMVPYTLYRVLKNNEITRKCMDHMPKWMLRVSAKMPAWTHWIHRIMMLAMDVMVMGMCVGFIAAAMK